MKKQTFVTIPIICIFLFTALSFSAYCQSNYYPLSVGNEWVYDWKGDAGETIGDETIRVVSYDRELRVYRIRRNLRIGTAAPIISEIIVEDRRGTLIQLAHCGGLFGGDEWRSSSDLLFRQPLSIGEKWEQRDVRETVYEVIEMVNTEVEAGYFRNVYKIRKESLSEGIKFYQYYAPSVGLILEEGILEDGNTFTFRELVSYEMR